MLQPRRRRSTTINAAFARGRQRRQSYRGVLEYSDEPLVSADIVGNPASCIFSALDTMANGRMVKVLGWYDNEWGYSNRLVDLVEFVGDSSRATMRRTGPAARGPAAAARARGCSLRVDFNVPLRDGKIDDDLRITAALPDDRRGCASAARGRGAARHLGRPKGKVDPQYSLAPVAQRLGELLGIEVPLAPAVVGFARSTAIAAASSPATS